jgi:hypothetical protein
MNQYNYKMKLVGREGILSLDNDVASITFPEDSGYQDKLAALDTPPNEMSDEQIWDGFKSSAGDILEFRGSLSTYELERLDSMLEDLREIK